MKLWGKVLLSIALLVVVVVIAAIISFQPHGSTKAVLLAQGRTTNGTITADFLLTNPGPDNIEYYALQEWPGTNLFLKHGLLAPHSTMPFRLPLSDIRTHLNVNCETRHLLRDVINDLRGTVGLPVPARSSEYVLLSDDLKQ